MTLADTAAPAAAERVRMGLIRRKADWTSEDFLKYWRGTHGPLAARAPNLLEYWQNAVTHRVAHGSFARGPWDFDGFSQLRLDDAPDAAAAFQAGAFAAELMADERHFLGTLHIVTAIRRVVVALTEEPQRSASSKRFSILKRRPQLGEDDFRRAWSAHGDLVRKLPGVSGYRQNAVIARERTKGRPSPYAELPIDGIAELWFPDAATMEAAFASPAGRAATAHAQTFLAAVDTFLVVEHRVV